MQTADRFLDLVEANRQRSEKRREDKNRKRFLILLTVLGVVAARKARD